MDALRPTAINIMVELRIERMTAGDGDGGAAMGGRIIKLLAGRTIFGERSFGEHRLPKMAGKTVPSRAHRKEKEREERSLWGHSSRWILVGALQFSIRQCDHIIISIVDALDLLS